MFDSANEERPTRRRLRRLAATLLIVLSVIGFINLLPWQNVDATHQPWMHQVSTNSSAALSGRVMARDIDIGAPSLASDQLVVELAGVVAPPAPASLRGYLFGSDDRGLFFGTLPVTAGSVNATFDFPSHNLIAHYETLRMMREAVVFQATLPEITLLHLRQALYSAPDTPDQVGYSVGLAAQANLLYQHAGFAKEAADAGSLVDASVHAEHVLNLLYGTSDPRYGDHDNDGLPTNPGDGYGVLRYSTSLFDTLQAAAASPDATQNVIDRVAEVQTTLGNIGSSTSNGVWGQLVIDKAGELLAATTTIQAQTAAIQLVAAANRLYNGQDLNDSGAVEPIANEGGALTAHQYSQRTADYLPPAASGISGRVQHEDADVTLAGDQLHFMLSGLPPLAAGESYWAYLVDANNTWLWLGVVTGSSGTLDSTITRHTSNLISQYQGLYLTTGALYADDQLPATALNHIRTAVYQASDTPNLVGYSMGLVAEGGLLYQHAGFAKEAADAGNLVDASVHAEHVLNILYGTSDPRYGDHDNDGLPTNPGDGYGIFRYSNSLSQILQAAATSPDASQNVIDRVADVQTTLGNVGSTTSNGVWGQLVIDKAGELLAATTAAQAQTAANQLVAAGNRLYNGQDLNDSGEVEPITDEGGALTAHQYSQHAADYFPVEQSPPPPTDTPTPTATTPGAPATVTPTPTTQLPSDVDSFEGDDSCGQARSISTDGALQGHNFHDGDDSDWLKFAATVNKTYVIQVTNIGPLSDAVIFLHDACDTSPQAFEGRAFGSTVRLEWNSPKTGDYYVQLQQFDPSFFGADANYQVSVTQDLLAPASPKDLRCIAKDQTTLGLQWKQNAERDVVGYRVTFRNANATNSGNRDVEGAAQTYVEVGSLTPNELYFLQVLAIDFSNNASTPSGEIQCRAALSTDITQPTVTLQQPAASSIMTTTASEMTFSGIAQDAGGNLSQVKIKNITKNVEGQDFSLAGSSDDFRIENLGLNVGDNSVQLEVRDDAGNSSQKTLLVRRLSERPGAAIIVAGHNETFGLQTNIYNAANRAYRIFKSAGFSDDNIYYIAPVGQDADGDGSPNTDATSSPAAVQNAITTWAKTRVGPDKPLFVYLIDHGFVEKFCASGCGAAGQITPADLDGWLRTLENDTGVAQVNVVIEACQSGSFIDRFNGDIANSLGKAGRVIIASTDRDKNAYASAQGAYFSDAFFSCVADSNNLKVCFDQAKAAVQTTGVNQAPWMDDNGDGLYNASDGTVAQTRHVTSFFSSIRPEIMSVSVTRQEASGVLSANVQAGAEELELVWASIRPPSFQEPSDVTLNLNVPTVRLEPDPATPGRYVFNYVNGFTEAGEYRIVFFAQDRDGINAVPRREGEQLLFYLPAIQK